MKIFAIKAFDDIFQGRHGMYQLDVIYAIDEVEACEHAAELADEVINDHQEIINALEYKIKKECRTSGIEYGAESIEEELIREEIYWADAAYQIWELDKEKISTLEFNDLIDMFYKDEDDFLEKYKLK